MSNIRKRNPINHIKTESYSDENQVRVKKIKDALLQDPVDILSLQDLAVNEGLVNNDIRRVVWPKLLGVTEPPADLSNEPAEHKDIDQVEKDVDRSLWKFTVGKDKLREEKREELSRIINVLLSKHPELHYYQGFHDIASVLLLVAGENVAYAMTERLSFFHIRDALDLNLEKTKSILQLLFPLIQLTDKELHTYLRKSGVEPFFALSWVLTWFSHGFDRLDDIARLFDLFIASHPLMPIYVGAQIILHFRDTLLNDVECEFASVHSFLSKISQDLPFEQIIQGSLKLFNRFPPKKLQQKARKYLDKNSPANTYPFDWMPQRKSTWFVQSWIPPIGEMLQSWSNTSIIGEEQSSNVEKVLFFTLFSGLVAVAAYVWYESRK